jgi:hypothetical protein
MIVPYFVQLFDSPGARVKAVTTIAQLAKHVDFTDYVVLLIRPFVQFIDQQGGTQVQEQLNLSSNL